MPSDNPLIRARDRWKAQRDAERAERGEPPLKYAAAMAALAAAITAAGRERGLRYYVQGGTTDADTLAQWEWRGSVPRDRRDVVEAVLGREAVAADWERDFSALLDEYGPHLGSIEDLAREWLARAADPPAEEGPAPPPGGRRDRKPPQSHAEQQDR